jgi:hypothetical protein
MTINHTDNGVAHGGNADNNSIPDQAAGVILIDGHQFARRLMALSLESLPEHLAFEISDILAGLRDATSKMSTLGYRPKCPIPDWQRRETITAGLAAIFNCADDVFDAFKDGQDNKSIGARITAVKVHRSIKKLAAVLKKVNL